LARREEKMSHIRRHPGERRDAEPRELRVELWVPAFAGITDL
jgi:hypothetical protein